MAPEKAGAAGAHVIGKVGEPARERDSVFPRVVADEVDRLILLTGQGGSGADTAGDLHAGFLAHLAARFDQGTCDVLRYQTFFVLPVLDSRSGDGGLQVAAVMVFGVP